MKGLWIVVLATAIVRPAVAQPAPHWAQLTADQQIVLRPLQPRWNQLPDYQRERLAGAAKRYPAMSAEQKRRFSERLAVWASLTLEERNQARAAYSNFAHMPKADQQRLKKSWFELHPTKEVANAGASMEVQLPPVAEPRP